MKNICEHISLFTLWITISVNAHVSLYRYMTIITPIPYRSSIQSFRPFCLGSECLLNSDLNMYAALLRRQRRITPNTRMNANIATNRRSLSSEESNRSAKSVRTGLNTFFNPSTSGLPDFVNKRVVISTTEGPHSEMSMQAEFYRTLDRFERKFYMATFEKLSSISPVERRENGISFVQSAFFLYLMLVALSVEVDQTSKNEIDKALELSISNQDKIELIRHAISSLPQPSKDLTFRWVQRLAINGTWKPQSDALTTLGMRVQQIDHLNSSAGIVSALNLMVEEDSGGAMRSTFIEEEVLNGVQAALISTVYLRARWRSAPTLLNGTHDFYDGVDTATRVADSIGVRQTHMIRINDIVRYADLKEWGAEAIEIFYSTPHLSLLILVPRKPFLRPLIAQLTNTSINFVTSQMRAMRLGVKLPIYTLRMTLLLLNKLEAMGITSLLDASLKTSPDHLKISHAVQRLMFWAEAGRNAFKDDGIEWDTPTELEISVNRPYAFFLRWKNVTIANGNFVL